MIVNHNHIPISYKPVIRTNHILIPVSYKPVITIGHCTMTPRNLNAEGGRGSRERDKERGFGSGVRRA